MSKESEVFLFPCSGHERLGIQTGHLYRISVDGKSIGYHPLSEALTQYPDATIRKSHSCCPGCADIIAEIYKQIERSESDSQVQDKK